MEAANAAVPKITPDQASDMIKKGNTLVVDVRDAPEVAASGKTARAADVSRGMLEFRADPDSPYHERKWKADPQCSPPALALKRSARSVRALTAAYEGFRSKRV